ncbi:MAG TPA: hypothetical protein VMZ28_00185 [Kofleriaceae bacterium]|nr:hypothetical protein [Kofleriaceae bacterium]
MKTVAASKFKEQCLSLIDTLGPEGLVITKHGRAVAKLIRVGADSRELIGCLRGKIAIKGDIESTGADWDADAEP